MLNVETGMFRSRANELNMVHLQICEAKTEKGSKCGNMERFARRCRTKMNEGRESIIVVQANTKHVWKRKRFRRVETFTKRN